MGCPEPNSDCSLGQQEKGKWKFSMWKLRSITWIDWMMSDFQRLHLYILHTGTSVSSLLHCSLGVYGKLQDITPSLDMTLPTWGKESSRELRGALAGTGQAALNARVRGSTALTPLEEGPPALLGFAPILWLCVGFTELLNGLTSMDLGMDLGNFYTARKLFLWLLVAFSNVFAFLQFTALLRSCSGCTSSPGTVESLNDVNRVFSSFVTVISF